MSPKKSSSRLHILTRAVVVGAIGMFMAIYIIVAGPEYRLINSVAHGFMPIANAIGDLITWPVRSTGKIIVRIHNIAKLEEENEELRARLIQALAEKNECDVAIAENEKLSRELGLVRQSGFSTILADIIHDYSALHHETFLVNRGHDDGVKPGMAVVSVERTLVGIVIDVSGGFSRVRALNDSNTNIAIRIAGSEVYGFLRGNGAARPTIGFFSDHKFQGSPGTKVITSNISGILPNGIYVGQIKNESDVVVVSPSELSRVMILKFNAQGDKYK